MREGWTGSTSQESGSPTSHLEEAPSLCLPTTIPVTTLEASRRRRKSSSPTPTILRSSQWLTEELHFLLEPACLTPWSWRPLGTLKGLEEAANPGPEGERGAEPPSRHPRHLGLHSNHSDWRCANVFDIDIDPRSALGAPSWHP